MSLPALQADFQAYVLGRESGIAGETVGPNEAFRRSRLAIYRDAYRLRLVEVLENDYPVLSAHLAADFASIATEYIAVHPSTYRNVRWFGANLAAFLRGHPRCSSRPEVAELAEFEWTLGLAFDAPDVAPVSFAEVAAVPAEGWPGLRFSLHPSLRTLKLRPASVELWHARDRGPSSSPADSPAVVDWVVWRKGPSPCFRSLDKDEAWALSAARAGRPFGDICAGLCDRMDAADAAPRAAQWLRAWVEDGWIAALTCPG